MLTARSSRLEPSLVRAKLNALKALFDERAGGEAAVERRLATLVEQALREYVVWLRPPAPTRRYFLNALRTTARPVAFGAGVVTVRCAACGAPREHEAVTTCQYCGALLEGDSFK